MCGIAGLLYFDANRQVDPELLGRMTDAVAHRGPDGRGTYTDGPLGLGHRRLSIIDLSAAGSQPMANEDRTVWVVLNGEIYNFQALRAELEQKGHKFRSRTDTEVIVHLYEEEGDLCVERLRGMFAFALWDERRRRLLLARDRFGKKPLYHRLDREALRFGSEVKAILEDPAVPRVADPIALSDYLSWGYVPAPRTAFVGIDKLLPGHTLAVEADGRARLRRYWALPLGPKLSIATRRDEEKAVEELRGLLDDAVRMRMISDVPLGAFLSGGLDSSSVVASMVAASEQSEHVRTFSIGYEEPAYDESGYASLVARHLHTSHETLVLHPDSFEDLQRIAWHHGEPFADSSCVPTFAVSRLARQRVTVALSGDGGDELLLGYERYRYAHVDALVRQAPAPLRWLARRPALGHLLWRLAPRSRPAMAVNALQAYLGVRQDDTYCARLEAVYPDVKRAVLSDGFLASTRGHDSRDLLRGLLAASPGETWAEKCAHVDVQTYLADDILVKVDVASMAYGLETRAPLLDHVLAEFVARLPARQKLRRLTTKRVLRRAVAPRLPREVLTRKKQGFGVPIDTWFRGRLAAHLEDVLLSQRARERGVLRPDAVRRLIDEHVRGERDAQTPLFTLLMLETWFQQWIDPAAPAARPAPIPAGAAV